MTDKCGFCSDPKNLAKLQSLVNGKSIKDMVCPSCGKPALKACIESTTLGELAAYCAKFKTSCSGCMFQDIEENKCILHKSYPDSWADLTISVCSGKSAEDALQEVLNKWVF